MSDSLSHSPDRKRSLEDESASDSESRNGRNKRQAVAEAAGDGERPVEVAVDDAAKHMTMRAIVSMKEAGMIIGKSGKNVADIRDSSGARVTVSENVPGAGERILTIVGPLDTVAKFLKGICLCATKIVEEQPSSGMRMSNRASAMKILIPHIRMGSIIGKAGILPHSTERIVIVAGVIDSIHIATYHIGAFLQSTLKSLKELCCTSPSRIITGQSAPRGAGGAGASSAAGPRHAQMPQPGAMYGQMPGNPYYPGMPAAGSAYAPYGVMPGAPGAAGGVGPMTPMMPGGAVSVQQIYIPNEMVGAIIGKGGSKINEIRTRTGCNIKIADPVVGATERLITVTGVPEANSMALYMLYQRLEMEKQKVRQ
ncbi:hypothetical protein BCR33DRAFT_850253 [Rhizoclosmatium globosum]|uniref:K Homology domain-containing protein n=1 Tax=Rhizoclosmatium globosum TaxID=329046 RepID=A0A1Y2CCW1_9FUNG|nr:hypothetical protein BCR33DRAFT_850253 [Rhizoclosmatium globosum]|eukprot:ORY44737.1 hypothetical protein BCR33DRAFT_850253 [Rhizoclosmatium globosum]